MVHDTLQQILSHLILRLKLVLTLTWYLVNLQLMYLI